jgi:hypothetical protein
MAEQEDWTGNYFNYFTEVEEHFQQARGTGLFLMSPLDWALVESWKNSGVPLEAVMRGIDEAFAKWRTKKTKSQLVNSLTYCSQAILAETERIASNSPQNAKHEVNAPFSMEELAAYLQLNADKLKQLGYEQAATSLEAILLELDKHYQDLEALEQRLTVMEEKLAAEVRFKQTEEELLSVRKELETALRPHRGKMTAAQLLILEKNFMDRRLFDQAQLPRLSLFYLV